MLVTNSLFHTSLRFFGAACALVSTLSYGQRTWSGATSTNWNTATNWTPSGVPGASQNLIFAGTSNAATNNNITGLTTGSINFTNTVAGQNFSLSGNDITLGGNITAGGPSSGAITDTINLNMLVTAQRSISAAGTALGARVLILNGVISGAGGITRTVGNGTVQFNGLNTYTGQAQLNSGTTVINFIADSGSAQSLGAGAAPIRLGSAAQTPILQINGSIPLSTNRQIQIGNSSAVPAITDTGGATLQNTSLSATNTVTFSNPNFNAPDATALAARTLTLGGTHLGTNLISGVIANNGASGTVDVNVTKADSGIWRLNGANIFTGSMTIGNGTLIVPTLANSGVAQPLGAGTSAIRLGNANNSGTLRVNPASAQSTDRQVQIGSGGIGGGSIVSFSINPVNRVTFTNAAFNAPDTAATSARTLTLGGANIGANTITGVIADNNTAGGGVISVIKDGIGAWTLAGANTYTGTTNINSGRLNVTGTINGSAVTSLPGTSLSGTGTLNSTTTILLTGETLVGDANLVTAVPTVLSFSSAANTTFSAVTLDLFAGGSSGILNPQATSNDQIRLITASSVTINSGAILTLANPSAMISFVSGTSWQIFDWGSTTPTTSFTSIDTAAYTLGSGQSWDFSQLYTSGVISIVPEPSRVALLMLGLVGVVARRHRRQAGWM
jgi:autotransporter-associated beta strand protein